MIHPRISFVLAAMMLGVVCVAFAQQFRANYDETKVPKYKLPDPLTMNDGTKVRTADDWRTKRRPELLKMFQKHVYGKAPGKPKNVTFEVLSINRKALDGLAVRKEVGVYFNGNKSGPKMTILIFLPAKAKRPVPIFLGYNFAGNHTVHKDPGISLGTYWARKRGAKPRPGKNSERGQHASRWQIEEILRRGYGVATIYYGDVDPDFDDGFRNGVHAMFYKKGQKPGPSDWGSIGTWAWALSIAVDYFETDEDIDHTRVAVFGFSRLGKTALWAGARDERIAMVISNNSGCGGAALSMRRFGETVGRINSSFPHWFCDNFNKYNNNEAALPVDQHMLIALIAPRPVYIASAVKDRWADPCGEFLSGYYANPVYRLLGKKGLPAKAMPNVDQPTTGTIGYHIRSGGHDVTLYDWRQYLDFADRHFKRKRSTGN